MGLLLAMLAMLAAVTVMTALQQPLASPAPVETLSLSQSLP